MKDALDPPTPNCKREGSEKVIRRSLQMHITSRIPKDFHSTVCVLTSVMLPRSCRVVVGVAEGELLCCKRSGRLAMLP